jgi:two-component system, sensor histidine kinase
LTLPADQLSAFLDAAPDAMVIAGPAGTIAFVNDAAEALLGYNRNTLVGQPIELLLPERFRNNHLTYRSAFVMAPRRRPMGNGVRLFALRRDGTEFPVEISLSPVHTERGTFVCSAIRDITERAAMEAHLLETSREAGHANRAKSAFLAAASHDLRQPLQTLALLHGALSREAAPGSKAAEILTMQGESLRVMSDLLNSLLDISKLEAGVVKPDIADCSVAAIFERLRAEFASLAKAKELDLIVERSDAIVRSDAALLAQIIQNLVANALRYTQHGWVRLRCLTDATSVRIQVLDTGIGIPGTELQRIFEEFYQLPRESGPREGLGLGLSIVRRIADLLGHELAVESTVGTGSCFSLNVPRSTATSVGSAPTSVRARAVRHDAGSVLVVDDDVAVSNATAMLLRSEGYVVALACDSAQACERLRSQNFAPDVLLCDYHLGRNESGVDAIRACRAALERVVPAILVTGDTSREMSRAAGEIGNCHLLSKPVNPETLLQMIAASIYRAERAIQAQSGAV